MTKLDERDILASLDKAEKQVVALEAENETLKLKVAELESKDHNFELKVAQKLAVLGITQEAKPDAGQPQNQITLDQALEAYSKLPNADARARYYESTLKNLI